MTRREFVRGSLAVAATSLAASSEPPALRVSLRGPAGEPLEDDKAHSLLARDLAGDTLPQKITHSSGESAVALASEPIQICCRLAVPGFGEVYCYADNNGKGYSRPGTVDFVIDAAQTRLNRVRHRLAQDPEAARGDIELERLMAAAQRPIPRSEGPARTAAAYESLARSLHAGERLALLSARRRIARLPGPRKDFFFGCATSGHDRSPDFEPRFREAFNFGTLSWYIWQKEEPVADQIAYGRMDESLQWCLDRKITPKGFGYVYLTPGAMPEWLRKYPYDKMLAVYKRVVEQTMRRYAGRLPFAEIINEAHDMSNYPRFNHAQILELTREACLAARRGSPEVKRQINNCCLWGEYAKNRNKDGSRKWTPHRYLSDCVKSNVQFERIGLQLYYPEQDLLEIERMLERFKDFCRPLHISEISCNSAPGLDPESMRKKSDVPGWHGPWTETMQADWVEAIYTMCYSKPEFEVVGWWDFADYGGHFWPHGGLLHKDFTPKESYLRLLKLKREWGYG